MSTRDPNAENANARVQLFNLETMSGVYPGTRTQVFQRVRLLPLPAPHLEDDSAPRVATWAILSWYSDPPACVVHQLDGATQRQIQQPILRIEAPQVQAIQSQLHNALAQAGWRLFTCGACHHWQSSATTSADGLPIGRCALRARDVLDADSAQPALVDVPDLLAAQSTLALGCPHWQATDAARAPLPAASEHMLELAPLPRDAVTTDSKKSPWQRFAKRVRRWLQPPKARPTLAQTLAERSGVGAGTEQCYSCQGRIANLGALVVATPENDKETLSVWRCRTCHTTYLSDWIDRWERVDSLETEETIYRIAPVEAAEILTLIATIEDADHPRQRGARNVERAWVHDQMQGRTPLSHMVKQGR